MQDQTCTFYIESHDFSVHCIDIEVIKCDLSDLFYSSNISSTA